MPIADIKRLIALFIAQIFGMTGLITILFIGGIVGMQLTPTKTLVTLPVAIAILGAALFAIPSALLMQKIGRKQGNMLAAAIACGGALLAAYAIDTHHFLLFAISAFFIGINSAFVQQYRFAIIEGLDPTLTAKAVSFLLFGNIISAYLGTELASISRQWFSVPYVGSFLVLACMLLICFLALTFYQTPAGLDKEIEQELTPLPTTKPIIQKNLVPAIAIAACSYFMMSLIMVATPVNMHMMHNFPMNKTTLVMQSHLIAMYLPSLFVGFLAQRQGNLAVVLIGISCLVACVIINLLNISFIHYLIALILLGVGWNFSFIAATTIFTESYLKQARFKMQAINDFFVFGSNALASLFSGTLVILMGWQKLNLISIIILIIMFSATWLIYRNNKASSLIS